MDLVQDIQEIPLGVNTGFFNIGEDLTDNLLARGCTRFVLKGSQIRYEFSIDKGHECPECALLKLLSL
ncbi:MAG: hypothetical protein DDT28_00202 [Dehalococcoidia bacterium]|nr:hypothetical protein [Chloroflexota bacterium]